MFDFADNRRPCVSCFSVRWAFCFLTTNANVASPSDLMFVFISSRPPRRSCCRPCLVGGRSVCQQDQTKTTKQTSTKLGWRMGPINLWFGIVREGVFSTFWLISQGNFYGSWWKKLSWAPWGFRYLWVVQFDTDLKVFTKDGPFSAATLTNLISIFINLLFFHNTLEIRTQSTLFCCASSQLLKIWWS